MFSACGSIRRHRRRTPITPHAWHCTTSYPIFGLTMPTTPANIPGFGIHVMPMLPCLMFLRTHPTVFFHLPAVSPDQRHALLWYTATGMTAGARTMTALPPLAAHAFVCPPADNTPGLHRPALRCCCSSACSDSLLGSASTSGATRGHHASGSNVWPSWAHSSRVLPRPATRMFASAAAASKSGGLSIMSPDDQEFWAQQMQRITV